MPAFIVIAQVDGEIVDDFEKYLIKYSHLIGATVKLVLN